MPGGFGIRGIEGKLGALTYARTHKIPTLGLCLGLQCMVIEYARQVAGLDKAASTEFDPDSREPVIATMAEQHAFVEGAGDLGGTMRLGLYPADLTRGQRGAGGVRRGPGRGAAPAPLRGQQRLPRAARGGRPGVLRHLARTTAWSSSSSCPRDVHPYYVATQAHPELRSRPTRPHPLFSGLVGAAIQRQRELLIPIDESALRRRWVADDDVTMDEPATSTKTGDPELDRARPESVARQLADEHLSWPVAGHPRPPPRRLGGGAARGHRAAARPSRRDLPPARGRAPRCRRRAGRRRGGAGLLLRQYRHAGRGVFVELPGRDAATSDDEDPQLTAARELREEAELQAEHWRHLLTLARVGGHHRRAAPPLPGHRALARRPR